MKRHKLVSALGLTLSLALAGGVFAQADLTGNLEGKVRLEDGSSVPGVLVTATSPALQGKRTAYSSETGQWILRNLPPGQYEVRFELEGMATVQSSASVSLGQVTPVDVTMGVAVQEETILVTGELPSVLASSEVSTTYNFQEVNNLPIGRDPNDIAELAPGLSNNSPNNGQVVISGAFAYDNVFLIDGVDANDNLFGTSNPVYIEDAIADLQVLTSGISAEYGRFTGGVVNVITKSGGNEFEGTLRADLENDDWREPTPQEEQRGTVLVDDISEAYSATFGGYVLKDKLWFFAAGRDEESSQQLSFAVTGLPKPTSLTEDRYEGKLTFNAADKHQFQATITDREQTGTTSSFSFSATPDTFRTRTDPSDLKVGRYSGILTSSLFAELQYSEKTFTFMNTHGLDADTTPGTQSFIDNSPFFDFNGNFGAHYHAPYFDGKDPEDRNNEQLAGSLSWFLDSANAGTHDLKVGVEDFSSFRTGGNSQTPTDWVMSADVVTDAAGNPVLNPDNTVTPKWEAGVSGAWNWIGNRDAEIELNTQSVFVNDRWQLNDKWSFNLGFRYEEVTGESQSGITTVDNDALVPRLAASYDVRGDGKYRFDLTYAQYAGKYSESQFAENTDVGNPPGLFYIYVGPDGEGYNFAPAYDFSNPDFYQVVAADDGTQNIVVADSISSPVVDEITFAAGMELKNGGFLKAVYTNREYDDFVEDFTCAGTPGTLCPLAQGTGNTDVAVMGNPAGTFDNTFIANSSAPSRSYQALQLIGRYRLTDRITINGNYTYQLENEGNFEGEGTNTPGISSILGDYPEIRSSSAHSPIGNLANFAEHKLRVWGNYNMQVGRAGNLNFALLANLDTGLALSATDTIGLTPIQSAILDGLTCTAAGQSNCYVNRPTNQTVFFGERGTVQFDDSLRFDFSLNYQLPLFQDLNIWLKADVINIFNDDAQIEGITNVTADFNGPVDELGIPTTFTPDANFGNAIDNDSFVDPREYRFTVGFRF